MRRKPNVNSRLVIGCGGSPHSGQTKMYAAAAGVKRSRQAGQHRWVTAGITMDSFRADRARRLGRPGSSRGRTSARHQARSTPDGARARTHAARAHIRGTRRSVLNQARVGSQSPPKPRSALLRIYRHRLAAMRSIGTAWAARGSSRAETAPSRTCCAACSASS
jgi:hypothetical protein